MQDIVSPHNDGVKDKIKNSNMFDNKIEKLHYVITGSGRSGTTFLANCFLEGGYNLGGVSPSNIGKNYQADGGGLEHSLFVQINNYICDLMKEQISSKKIACRLKNIMNFNWPYVLKDPRFSATFEVWGMAGYIPKHVFLAIREPDATIKSMKNVFNWVDKGKRYDFYWQYKLIAYCLKYDIPITYVLFPRIGRDEKYARSVFNSFFKEDPWSIVKKVWKEDMVHNDH